MTNDRQDYQVTLRPEPGMTPDEAERSLRSFLKTVLRSHGFRCTLATPIAAEAIEPQMTDATDSPAQASQEPGA